MPIDPTRKGKYRIVRPDGTELEDQHNYMEEVYGKISTLPNGTYKVLPPWTEVVKTSDPPEEQPPEDEPPADDPPVEEPPVEEPPPPTGEFKGFDLPPLVFGQPITGKAPVPLPGLGGSFTDPMSGLPITRATDGRARQNYSRRPPWNSDETYFIAYVVDGGSWELHDGATCQKIRTLPGLAGDNCEPLWHPTDPKLLWYFKGLAWYELNVDSGAQRQLFTLKGRLPPEFDKATEAWTKGEGRASDDGTVLFLMLTNYNSGTQNVEFYGMVCVNPMTGEILGTKATREAFDHCSTSHSGRWGVYSGSTTFAVDPTFSEKRHLFDGTQHSDLAIAPNGKDDVIAYAQFRTADDDKDGKNDDGYLMFHNIDTGEVDDLLGTYIPSGSRFTSYHICGQGRPGWVVVSAYEDNVPSGGALGEIYRRVCLIELRNGGQKLFVTPTRQEDTDYFDEPQATCNKSMSRIMFASTMGPRSANNGYSNAWIVDVPFKQ